MSLQHAYTILNIEWGFGWSCCFCYVAIRRPSKRLWMPTTNATMSERRHGIDSDEGIRERNVQKMCSNIHMVFNSSFFFGSNSNVLLHERYLPSPVFALACCPQRERWNIIGFRVKPINVKKNQLFSTRKSFEMGDAEAEVQRDCEWPAKKCIWIWFVSLRTERAGSLASFFSV